MADLAIMMSGHISIPIYPSLNASSINQILVHSESRAIIIGKLDSLESQQSGIPDIHKICVGPMAMIWGRFGKTSQIAKK
jgi:long-chain acyl-CoA synthetase